MAVGVRVLPVRRVQERVTVVGELLKFPRAQGLAR